MTVGRAAAGAAAACGAHLHLRRAVVGLRRDRLTDGDDELGAAEDDLVARLQLGLVDLLPVDQRALGRAEIDDVDLARARRSR